MAAVAEPVAGDDRIGTDLVSNVVENLDRTPNRLPRLPELGIGTGNAEGSKATQFKPKDPSAPRPAKPKPARRPQPSPLLKAMRHVFQYDPDADETYAHQHCREWLEDDLKGFLARLADLEKAHAASRR